MKDQTERGYEQVLAEEGERDLIVLIECWLPWIYDGSVPTRGYIQWVT